MAKARAGSPRKPRKVAGSKPARPRAAKKGAAKPVASAKREKRPAPAKKSAASPPAVAKQKPAAPRVRPGARPAPAAPAQPPAASGVVAPPRAERSTLPDAPVSVARAAQLDWEPAAAPESGAEDLVARWVRRGDELLRRLAEHGAAQHEYRADLKEGRFVWIDAEGRVSAEARSKVLCSWSRSTSVLAMAWADPLVRSAGISRIDGVASERDDVDEETAWRIAMDAAEAAGAEYLYRVPAPHAWYFLALRGLTFSPKQVSWTPASPVGLVLRALAETRVAVESRAEPTDVIRQRLQKVGTSLLHQASYAYRGTDWVARLERTGKRLLYLAGGLPRESYSTVAAGRSHQEWLDRENTVDLIHSLTLLEDEWGLFG